jgi:hypothetical protein
MLYNFIFAIGVCTTLIIICSLIYFLALIIGNIYGGILGAFRIERLGNVKFSLWQKISNGFKCWNDKRNWVVNVNGLQIPIDGRVPIPEPRIPG